MPIYAYRCASCGHAFDRLQKLSDPDPDTCPSCGTAGAVQRQITAPAFRLAGSGWYETDFKKDGDRKKNLVDGSAGGASSDSAGKADGASKPDAAPAGKSDAAAAKGDSAKPSAPSAGTSSSS